MNNISANGADGSVSNDEQGRVGGPYKTLPKLPLIPRKRYIDETFYQQEVEHMFKKTWLQVAHVSEFEKVGSYLSVDLPFAPVVLVKGKDNVIRAFFNACRHRGAKVVREESGCAGKLVCQYHSWTYDLTGKLIGLPAKNSFPDLIMEDLPLQSIRCELWGGFVFINLDEGAQSLEDWMEPVTRRFAEQANAPLRITSKQAWDIGCNWKMAVEAFREPYHVPTVHPQTAAAALDGYNSFFELYPHGAATLFIPYSKMIMEQAFSGVSISTSTLPRLSGTDDEKYNTTTLLASVFPNAMIGFQPSGFPLITAWPLSATTCRLEVHWYGMDWGDGETPEEWQKIIDDFTTLSYEDIANLETMQKSIEADPDKGMPVSTLECTVYQLHSEIDKVIGSQKIDQALHVPDVLDDFLIR